MSGTTANGTTATAGIDPDPDASGSADSLEGTVPARPRNVPATAVYVPAERLWELKQMDAEGQPHGPFRSWRIDGSPLVSCVYDHGKEVGASWKFHPDGSLFSLGCFFRGAERGVHRRYASEDPQGERLQSCCVPPGAWQLRQDYSRPNAIDRGWFDRYGRRLTEAGEPYPDRPPTVPAEAWLNEGARIWEAGVVFEETGYTGTRRQWSLDGVLLLVEELIRGKRHGQTQAYDQTGALLWEAHFSDGQLAGAFHAAKLANGQPAVAGGGRQLGMFEEDQAVGMWRAFDQAGTVVYERDLGRSLDRAALVASPALLSERRSADDWRHLAEGLIAEGRVGEALIAAARAAAAGDPAEMLRDVLQKWCLPVGVEVAAEEARQALERAADDAVVLLDGLKRGGEASTLLWALARALPDNDSTALDLVCAALVLAPEATEPLATRTLLYAATGDLQAARADASRLAAVSPDSGNFLDLYLRIYFPRFTFWPAAESFADRATDITFGIERSAAEVREVIQRYATRLGRLREALLRRLAELGRPDDVPFMIPDLSALLPGGQTSLARWTFEMSAEEYGGEGDADASVEPDVGDAGAQPSTVEIVVDEAHDLVPPPRAVLDILRRARADWSGLTWLCWAVGLDRPALPDTVQPPATFGAAAVMSMERTWRCYDKFKTSGLMALTKGIPPFDWEGTSIDLIPSALADVALEQYLEARAVFSWLCDPANRSPWQNDLRRLDD